MDIPHDLVLQLTELSETLDDPGTDLQAMLAVLTDDLRAAVPSFLGLRITIDGDRFTLAVLPPAVTSTVTTSLLMPLDALGVPGPGVTMIFYAARPGAFVDLAADTRFAYGLDGQVVLDRDLPSPGTTSPAPGISGLTEASTINQAIGVLIGNGHPPDDAHRVLQHHADHAAIPLHQAAQWIMNNPTAPGGCD